jgi:hypothetical protein
MQWSLEDIYKKQVRGNIPPRKHLHVLGETYDVKYKKETDPEYTELKVGDEQFSKAVRYLKADSGLLKQVKERLQETRLTDQQIKELINIVYDYDNPEIFFQSVLNRMNVEEFFAAPGGDVVDLVAKKYGLERDLVVDLLRFEPTTKPSTGKGEVFMMLFIDGAKKGSVGDVDINGVEYEIKGSGARLKGQHGFGAHTAGARTMKAELEKLISKSGLDFDITDASFDIRKTDNGVIDQIANELVATGDITKEDIAEIYAKGLKEVYENADLEKDLLSWIRNDLNEDGTMKAEEFKSDYFLFGLRYYTKQENFNYLVSIGTAPTPLYQFGKMRFVTRDDILSGNVFSNIGPGSWPSFTPRAGSLGGQFSVRPVIGR